MTAWHGLPPGLVNPPRRIENLEEIEGERTPGTVILAAVFLAAFILYYFVNWKLLSLVWKIG